VVKSASRLVRLRSDYPFQPLDQFAYFTQHLKESRIRNYIKVFILYDEEEEYFIIKITFDFSLKNNASVINLKCWLGVK
jgi:hypothetical protein